VNIIGNDKLMAGAMFFFGKKKNNILPILTPLKIRITTRWAVSA
jgi:hypothetical protein